jgi:hypothetical protein
MLPLSGPGSPETAWFPGSKELLQVVTWLFELVLEILLEWCIILTRPLRNQVKG